MAVLFANNATGRLAGSIDSTQVTISLQAGEGSRFPSPTGNDWFPITFQKADGSLEIMHCTSRTNDVLTVTRAREGTIGKSFAAGDRCGLRITAATLEQIKVDSFPAKGIILWNGSIDNIPEGWALCDGFEGRPDLTDKFVVGAGKTYAVGDTGGANSVTLTEAQIPAHNHTLGAAGGHSHSASTGSAGSHSHSGSTNTTGNHGHYVAFGSDNSGVYDYGTNINGSVGPASASQDYRANISSGGNHSHSLSINSNGSHTHSVSVSTVSDHSHSVANTGGSGSHENRPPYFALAYIQKL